MCKSIDYMLDGVNEIVPYVWYALKAKNILDNKNCYGISVNNIDELPNIVHESVLILKKYNNELEKEKAEKAGE